MKAYFARRLLLVPVTFLIITFVVYWIIRIAPGGPIEQAQARQRMAAAMGESGGGSADIGSENLLLDEDSLAELTRYYSLDRSIPVGYLQWLGLYTREVRSRVPIVSRKSNPEESDRLVQLLGARDAAVTARDEHLATEQLVAFRGELYRRVEVEALPEGLRDRAPELAASTFGERFELRGLLRPAGFAYDGAGYLHDASEEDWSSNAAAWDRALELVRAADDATKALEAYELESGLYLDESSHLRYEALRPLRQLREHWAEADGALQAHLAAGSKAMLEFDDGPIRFAESLGRLYRTLRPAEWVESADFEVEAARLAANFSDRDDLTEHLRVRGMAWKAGRFLKRFETGDEIYEEVAAAHGEQLSRFLATYERIAEARAVASRKLGEIREATGYEVSEDGVVYAFERRFAGIFQGDFGESYTHGEPVLSLIFERMKISVIFGLCGFFLTYLICIPLGVAKAVKHRGMFDTVSSMVVFLGYSIPGFVLCTLLFATVATIPMFDWIPLGGAAPPNIEELGWFAGLIGRLKHMIVPVAGYMVGSFATLTILTKNSLLDNLSQDYVRTAFAKGLKERRVLFIHALRNSLIPVTATIGSALGLLFAGSFLIEVACNIDGMGFLGFQAIRERDYPITLGLLVFGVLIRLFGNIFSDLIWALIDPRIRFGK